VPPAPSSLTWPDYAVLAVALGILLAIGVILSREQHDTVDFFLARRRVPWWAASLSFLATEITAVTIISVPAAAYSENWQYAQFFVGSSLAKLAVVFVFIPAFYRHDVTTIYEFLAHRFGRATQVTASIFFFGTRLAGSGVRLMAAAMAVAILMGWPLLPTLLVFTIVSIAYIATGGVKAVVWTNVVQALTFLLAGGVALAYLVSHIDGGVAAVVRTAGDAGRLDVINWGPSPSAPDFWKRVFMEPSTVWIAVLGGFVGSTAAFGTDHDFMQRLLTVETQRKSQWALALTPLATLLTLTIYLGLGAALYTFYAQNPSLPVSRPDEILPHYVQQGMPALLRGLMLSTIVLASIDSPLGSLAASFVTDIYRPLLVRERDEQHYLIVSRITVVVVGLVLGAIAYAFSFVDGILWLAFKIGGVTFGPLLGVFLLGLLSRRPVRDRVNVLAMIVMAMVNLVLLALSETGWLPLAWSWLVILGTGGTIAISALAGRLRGESIVPPPHPADISEIRTP
jgi:solute:Na+ symporter, SSS family